MAMARLVVTLSVVLLTVRARRITSFSVPRWVNVGEERGVTRDVTRDVSYQADHVKLSCGVRLAMEEEKEAVISWYYNQQPVPFLLWRLGTEDKPRVLGRRFQSRLTGSELEREGGNVVATVGRETDWLTAAPRVRTDSVSRQSVSSQSWLGRRSPGLAATPAFSPASGTLSPTPGTAT